MPGLVLPGQTLDTPAPSTPACLPQPVSLDARAYVRTALPVGLLVCLCLLQAFGYRLRRVIAAFYFPKVRPPGPAHACARAHELAPSSPPHPPRPGTAASIDPCPLLQREKKRILFLYNELLRKRAAFTQLRRAAIVRQAQQQRAPVSPGPGPCGSWLGLRTVGEGCLPSVHPAPSRPWPSEIR